MECGSSQYPEAVRFLKDAQGRIRAMALVHGSIFRTSGERPGLRDHLLELTRNVLAAHGRHDSISLQAEIDDIALTPEELMPLSLLVNELLTNSIKYAFAPKEHGIVRLSLKRTEQGIDLTYSDNGSGFGMHSSSLREGSFGMQLIQALAIQLNGHIRLLEGSGTTLVLSFAEEQSDRRLAS
jgi:two-component sensor histidine kinase